MGRFKSIGARIGTGGLTLLAFWWMMTPEGKWFSDDWTLNKESLIYFLVAFFSWIAAELGFSDGNENAKQQSESVSTDEQTAEKDQLSANDFRCARQLLVYHRYWFRDLLKEQDLGAYFSYDYMRELHAFNAEVRAERFEFLREDVCSKWKPVAKELKVFGEFMSNYSTPEIKAGREVIRLDPHYVDLGFVGAQQKPSKADEGNQVASSAWDCFDKFISEIKSRFPSITDDPVEPKWFYLPEQQS